MSEKAPAPQHQTLGAGARSTEREMTKSSVEIATGRLALYTTVYPGAERYFPAWYSSMRRQTDVNFDLWIGVDGADAGPLRAYCAPAPPITWVFAASGESPAQLRENAISRMILVYPAVVLVDCDDIMEPNRVKMARRSLRQNDVTACAMRVIDADGRDLGLSFRPPDEDITELLAECNIFGFGNTAYRSRTLGRCLPIPAECRLVDWFLATRAWASGAKMHFDNSYGMAYRQYADNVARVVPPFTPQQVLSAVQLVSGHYDLVLASLPATQRSTRARIEAARQRVSAFCQAVVACPSMLEDYVQALNQLTINHVWWSIVAQPQLEWMWNRN